jgi:hypothetical protein
MEARLTGGGAGCERESLFPLKIARTRSPFGTQKYPDKKRIPCFCCRTRPLRSRVEKWSM